MHSLKQKNPLYLACALMVTMIFGASPTVASAQECKNVEETTDGFLVCVDGEKSSEAKSSSTSTVQTQSGNGQSTLKAVSSHVVEEIPGNATATESFDFVFSLTKRNMIGQVARHVSNPSKRAAILAVWARFPNCFQGANPLAPIVGCRVGFNKADVGKMKQLNEYTVLSQLAHKPSTRAKKVKTLRRRLKANR